MNERRSSSSQPDATRRARFQLGRNSARSIRHLSGNQYDLRNNIDSITQIGSTIRTELLLLGKQFGRGLLEMEWTRSETLALAMHNCAQCHGSGLRFTKKGAYIALQLRLAGDFSDLLGPVHTLCDAGEALEPRFARAARGPRPPVDLGQERRRVHRGFLSGRAPSSGRVRESPVPLSFPAGRGLEIVHPANWASIAGIFFMRCTGSSRNWGACSARSSRIRCFRSMNTLSVRRARAPFVQPYARPLYNWRPPHLEFPRPWGKTA